MVKENEMKPETYGNPFTDKRAFLDGNELGVTKLTFGIPWREVNEKDEMGVIYPVGIALPCRLQVTELIKRWKAWSSFRNSKDIFRHSNNPNSVVIVTWAKGYVLLLALAVVVNGSYQAEQPKFIMRQTVTEPN